MLTRDTATFRSLARSIQVVEYIVLAQSMLTLPSVIVYIVFYFVMNPLCMYNGGFVQSGSCQLRSLDTRILRPVQ